MTPKNVKSSADGNAGSRKGRWPRRLRVGLKVLAWTVGSVLGLVIIALIFLQTPFVKRWIIRTVEDSLAEKYNADFSIGSLEGVLFTGAMLRDVTISNPPDYKAPYFVVVKETEVKYNPFEMLAGEVRLRVARVVGAEVVLEELPGGRLNVSEIFPRRDVEKETVPLVVDDVRLVNAAFRYDYLDGEREDFEFSRLSGRVSLDLDAGDVGLSGIDISGRTNLYRGGTFWVSGGMKVIKDGPIRFDGLTLATPSSMVHLVGEFSPAQDRVDLEVFSPRLDLAELRAAGLERLDPSGEAEFAGHLGGRLSDPQARFSLKLRRPSLAGYSLDGLELEGDYSAGRLTLDELRLYRDGGRAFGSAVFDLFAEQPVVRAGLDFYGLDPAELAPETLADLPGDLNGRISLEEEQGQPGRLAAQFELFPSRLRGVRIEQLRLAGHGTTQDFALTEGLLRVGGSRIGARGRLTASGLALAVEGSGVSLERLSGLAGIPLGGRLDFRAVLEGSLENLAARFDLKLTGGSGVGLTVEEARLSGGLNLVADGERLVPGNLLLDLEARGCGYGDYRARFMRANGELSLTRPAFNGELRLAGLEAAGWSFEELEARGLFDDGRGEIERLHLVVDEETSLAYRGRFELRESGMHVATELIHFIHRDFDLLNARPFVTELTEARVRVEEVELVTAAGSFSLVGEYAFEEEELVARLLAPELDLGALSAALELTEEPVSGLARLDLEVSGRPVEPRVRLELALAGVGYGDYHLRTLALGLVILPGVNTVRLVNALAGVEPLPPGGGEEKLGYLMLAARQIGAEGFEVDRLRLDGELTGEEFRLVGLDASLVGGSLDAVGRLGLTDAERPLELYVGAYSFPLDKLPLLPDTVEVEEGRLQAQVLVSGPLESLRADGRLQLTAKKLELYHYNLTLNDLELGLGFTPEAAELTRFGCLVGGGRLTGSGRLDYGPDFLEGEAVLTGTGLRVKNLADLFSGEANLAVRLEVSPAGTQVTGLVEVVEGNVDLPAGGGAVAAGRPAEDGSSTLRLDLRLVAEKNLWVRSDLAELEVGADLRLSLAGDELALGGDLVTRRGSVYFLNKAFDLDTGKISFDRMVPPDPKLDIRATSRMRRRAAGQTTEELTLVVSVGGRLSEPKITLSCAEHPEWPERDILMLIALDMTWDDYQRMLAEQGAGGATRHATSQAAFFLAGFIETKLQRLAREAVGLDTVKIEGVAESGEIDRLDVTLGKYLFRDLYVSYSRDMLAEGNQSFSLEYFITDSLSLVGTTVERKGELGYDLDLRWRFKY